MDWQTIATSVLASLVSASVIVSAVIYMLKRSFDKTLDLKFEQMLERSKLETQERARRKTELFDKQAAAYQQLLSMVYRLRNISRELREVDPSDSRMQELVEDHHKYVKELGELIYENRAILPESVFHAVHRAKNLVAPLVLENERHLRAVSGQPPIDGDGYKARLEAVTVELDNVYTLLVDLIQPRLGVVADGA